MKSRSIRIALIAGSLGVMSAAPALAQSSQTFNLGATVSVCNSCDLPTQNALAAEDDRHDQADASLDADTRSENVAHDQFDITIEQSNQAAEFKQEDLANEEERHQNALTAIQRERAIEAARHQQFLAEIMAKAGKLLSDLTQNGAPGVPNGGTPQQAGGSQSAGNPQQAGSGGTPQQPGGSQSASNPPSNGGSPPGNSPSPGPASASNSTQPNSNRGEIPRLPPGYHIKSTGNTALDTMGALGAHVDNLQTHAGRAIPAMLKSLITGEWLTHKPVDPVTQANQLGQSFQKDWSGTVGDMLPGALIGSKLVTARVPTPMGAPAAPLGALASANAANAERGALNGSASAAGAAGEPPGAVNPAGGAPSGSSLNPGVAAAGKQPPSGGGASGSPSRQPVGALASAGNASEGVPPSSGSPYNGGVSEGGGASNPPSGGGGSSGGGNGGSPPPSGGGEEPGGYVPPRPTMKPTVKYDPGLDRYEATWGSDPKAWAMFSKSGSGVVVTDLYRGGQPTGSGGVMLADALRSAGIKRPSFIRFQNIIEENTVAQINEEVPLQDTKLGHTMSNAAGELGGKVSDWQHGVDRGQLWMTGTLSY